MNNEKGISNIDFFKLEDLTDVNVECVGEDFAISNYPLSCVNFYTQPIKIKGLVLALCISGTSTLLINLKKYVIKTNDILILPPGQVVQYVDRSSDFSMHSMYMSTAFFTENTSLPQNRDMTVFFTIRDNPCFNITKEDTEIIKQYHNLISKRIKSKENPCLLDTMRYIMNALMTEMSSILDKYLHTPKNAISRKDDICHKFMKLLMENYKKSRQVSFYADKLFLTPKYLSNTLKQVTGRKAGQLIDEYVILQAKVLLQSTNMTIQQISEELNFANQSFFGHYFKHLTGLAPSQYRK